MAEENKGATQDSPSALEEVIASSPEAQQQSQETQTETAQQSVTQEQAQPQEKEPPFHQHPRFRELIEENRWLKQNMEQLIQERQRQLQIQQPASDPYAGMSLEEKNFWIYVDKKIDERAGQLITQKVNPMIDAGRNEFVQLKIKEFRQAYPDIKPNSPEEIAIAEKINIAVSHGFPLNIEEAYWMVMGAKGVRSAEDRAKQQVKKQMEAKKQANVEGESVPVTSSYSPKEKLTLRQRLERNQADIDAGKI